MTASITQGVGSRANRQVGFTLRGNIPEELLAVVGALDSVLPGIKHQGVHEIGKDALHVTHFRFYLSGFIQFELTPSGYARPTQKQAIRVFKEGRLR